MTHANTNTNTNAVAAIATEASHSISLKPVDSRCRYWSKVIRAGVELPKPDSVIGAETIPGEYARRGDEEIAAGDVVFEGEANHHRRNDRGWTYRVSVVTADGKLVVVKNTTGLSEVKALLKAQGMATELLKGSGDIAAMVRIAHGVRAGMRVKADTATAEAEKS